MSISKRRQHRIEQETSVEFAIENGGKTIDATITNLSTGGVFIVTDQKIKPGASIQMRFNVPSRFQEIEARGKVVWQGKRNRKVGIGVEFLEIDPIELYDLMRGVKPGGWLYAMGVLGDSK